MAKEVLLSEPPMGGGGDGGVGGGGAPAAPAPPPPQGLGNFKGVMLCNRPLEPGQAAGFDRGEDGQPPPFRSRVSATHGERLGLNPCAKAAAVQPVKKYRNESLEKHGSWLRKLQKNITNDQVKREEAANAGAEKEARIKNVSAKYREEVRAMLAQRNAEHEAQLAADTHANRVMRGLVSVEKKKPLWAMTEQEVSDFDREAAEDLIDFAEGLDYDKYIVDLEFREALNVMKDRVGRLSREQESFKQQLVKEFNTAETENPDDLDVIDELGESASQVGSNAGGGARKRPPGSSGNADDRPDWDGSSSCADGPGRDQAKSDLAKDILASNSQMRAVHSKESLQRILEKQKKAEGGDPPSEVAGSS